MIKHQKILKILKSFGIVTSAAIAIHEIYFDIYADSAITYVAYESHISSIYGTLREIQVSTSFFRITIHSKVERNQNPLLNEFLFCISFFLRF